MKRVELRGFKSMGSKQITVTFDPGFTVITGPNGSGKSNIIDAVLFALGENNPKTLRVNKLTSLIYDGGAESPKPISTKVSITLDNADRRLPMDSETVLISRELKQNGDNAYFLNGKHVQKNVLVDILQLGLLSTHGLNIVPQGMIMRISELVPDEKRKLIEQIVGVSQFDEKKEEAMKQLREADVKLEVALARIGEIKGNIESLEEERNDQLRFKQLEDGLRYARAVVSSRNLEDATRRLGLENEEMARVSVIEKELSEKVARLTEEHNSLEAEKNSFVQSFVEEGGGKKVEIEFSIARTSQELELLNAELKETTASVDSLREALPSLGRVMEEQEDTLREKTSELLQLQEEINAKVKLRLGKEAEISAQNYEVSKLQNLLAAVQARREVLTTQVRAQERIARELSLRIETLKTRRAVVEERIAALKSKGSSFELALASLKDTLNRMEEIQQKAIDSAARVETKISAATRQREILERLVVEADITLKKAEAQIQRVELERQFAESLLRESVALQWLDARARKDWIVGYIGLLRSLLKFHPDYRKAVFAAANTFLDAIVVDDVASMLKVAVAARRIGLKNYLILPLSEVRKNFANSTQADDAIPETEGIIGRLTDVVDSAQEISDLAQYLFGQTLVARTVEGAYLASQAGFRAVTLSGELFEPKLMSYSFGSKKDGVASDEQFGFLSANASKLERAKQVVCRLQESVRNKRESITMLEQTLRRSLVEGQESNVAEASTRAREETFQALLSRYSKINDNLRRKSVNLEKVCAGLEVGISKTDAKLEGNIGTRKDLQNEIEALSEQKIISEIQVANETATKLQTELQEVEQSLRNLAIESSTISGTIENSIKPGIERTKSQRQEVARQTESKERRIFEVTPRIDVLTAKLDKLKLEETTVLESTRKSKPVLESYDVRLRHLRTQIESSRRLLSSTERDIGLVTRRVESLREGQSRFQSELSLYGFSQPLEVFDECEELLESLNDEYELLRSGVNLLADRNYREIFEGYKNLSTRRNQLESERDKIVRFIEDIDTEKNRVFTDAFTKVDRELRDIFSRITGGSGWLELEKADDVFSGGLFLMTQFPGKIPRESSGVSGGEKTVSALSFILAIQSCFPSPFYLFDEIDAHLDPVNSDRLAEMILEKSRNSQIIVVSLKDSIVSRASTAYGVYLVQGNSRVVRYRPGIEVAAS